MGGTLVFSGDTNGYTDRYDDDAGWVRAYSFLGLRNRADYIPVTDAVTLTDTAIFNLPGDDPDFIGSRAGLTVGQIVSEVLTMLENATELDGLGIGAYTSLTPPTLPSATVSDLAALTVIPPCASASQANASSKSSRVLYKAAIPTIGSTWSPMERSAFSTYETPPTQP